MEWTDARVNRLELALLAVVLVVLGIVHFSQLTPQRQHQLELQVGLEQLYHLEEAHFEEHGSYFNPAASEKGLQWAWMRQYTWDVRLWADGFRIMAQGDLDGDGEPGMWVDSEDSVPRQVGED